MIETRAHARLSPSAATRWMACPGSVRLCESVVDAGSDDANKGTACHAVLEQALKFGADPKDFVDKKTDVGEGARRAEIMVTAEMAGWVQECLDWVREYLGKHPGAFLKSEDRIVVGRAFGAPDDLWGTADIVVTSPDELCVADAKFGYNEVAVVNNPQLMLYLTGVAADYGFIHRKYRIAILQPQAGEPKEHEVSLEEVLDFRDRTRPKIAATQDPDAPLVPTDDGCHWCAAAGICPELQKRALAMAQREFASVETLPVVDLATLCEHADRIRAGLKAAEDHARRLIQIGVPVPGFKVVAGDKRRAWKDEKAARKQLKKMKLSQDEFEPRSLVTPAQAEKLVGRKNAALLAPFIEKPKGDPTLAHEADPRPALAPEFQALDAADAVIDIPLSANKAKALPASTAAGAGDLL